MIRGSAGIVAVACGVMIPAAISGQEVGDRVRVTFGANWVVGEVVRMSRDELELAVAGGGSWSGISPSGASLLDCHAD